MIVYGSLYPWHFVSRELLHNPAWILIHTWHPRLNRFTIRDIVVNLGLYLPLGMTAFLVFRSSLFAILLGFALSFGMETAQLFAPTRNASGLDVLTNVAGSVLGVFTGMAFNRLVGTSGLNRRRLKVADRSALLLLFLGIGWLLFPFFPHVGLYQPRMKLHVFLAAPLFVRVPLLTATAVWLATGHLLTAAGFKRVRLWLAASIVILPLQIFLVDRQPMPSDLIGAVCGTVLFLFSPNAVVTSGLFVIMIIVRGLQPFRLTDHAASFSVVPFSGMLRGEWQGALRVLIEKSFFYGAAVWFLNRTGMVIWKAAGEIAAILLAIELLQVWLPNRTPELTDPVLALIAGFVIAGLLPAAARKPRVR